MADRIFDNLSELSRKRNQKLVFLYLPTKTEIISEQPTSVSRWVQIITEQKHIPFLNMTKTFKALSSEELTLHFLRDGHLSERGNGLVAKTLLNELREVLPEFPRDNCSDSSAKQQPATH